MTTSDGLPVQDGFQPIAAGTTAITISPNGAGDHHRRQRHAEFPGATGAVRQPGRLAEHRPQFIPRNARVRHAGNRHAGQNGFGSLQQGYLEMSNVKVVEEMVNMIVAQRAYEVNSKAVQAADEMMQQSNNLRR